MVHFSSGWLPQNCSRSMEVSGDRGKAVWYMCWADIWIGRKKWRVNRRQSMAKSGRGQSTTPTFHSFVVNDWCYYTG